MPAFDEIQLKPLSSTKRPSWPQRRTHMSGWAVIDLPGPPCSRCCRARPPTGHGSGPTQRTRVEIRRCLTKIKGEGFAAYGHTMQYSVLTSRLKRKADLVVWPYLNGELVSKDLFQSNAFVVFEIYFETMSWLCQVELTGHLQCVDNFAQCTSFAKITLQGMGCSGC